MDFQHAGFIENLLNRTLELTVHHHLEDIDSLQVDIASSTGQLLQGKADIIRLEGDDVQATETLHVEHLSVQIKRVAIALVSMAMGKLELTQPARLTACVVLSEDDLNMLLNRGDVKAWIQDLSIDCDCQRLNLAIDRLDCTLPASDILALTVLAHLHHSAGERCPMQLQGQLRLEDEGRRIYLEQAQFMHPHTPLLAETAALLTTVSNLLHRRSMQLDALSLHIQSLTIEDRQMVLRFKAEITDLQELLA